MYERKKEKQTVSLPNPIEKRTVAVGFVDI